ncbi:hypothetical protein QCD71_19735, partial [Sphingomonas sp. PsM26]|nr:hypothetical protein [Sphingomonas sp. PsM26]
QDGEAAELRTTRLTTRLGELRRQMRELEAMEQVLQGAGTTRSRWPMAARTLPAGERGSISTMV